MPRHLLDIPLLNHSIVRLILDQAATLKAERTTGIRPETLKGKSLAMIFEKPSTRTRVSFELAMHELGGYPMVLSASELQLGRGESVADTARVLSRYADAIMVRCHNHETLEEMARVSSVPIINGLSDMGHPCQWLADVLTFEEHRGSIEGKTVAWVGDGNNMAHSWIEGAALLGYHIRLACPERLDPDEDVVEWARAQGAKVTLTRDPLEAVHGVDAVLTDTWVSMGDRHPDKRLQLLETYQVNTTLMSHASPDAVFLHCLPAHREEEVTAEVLDGPQSVVWDEAENRLHVQKGVLLWCLEKI